jgi:hypothetical protein
MTTGHHSGQFKKQQQLFTAHQILYHSRQNNVPFSSFP